MIASEVDRVMRARRSNEVEVMALHNHKLDDEPRLFFMHFWGNQDAQISARGLRVALNGMNIQKP